MLSSDQIDYEYCPFLSVVSFSHAPEILCNPASEGFLKVVIESTRSRQHLGAYFLLSSKRNIVMYPKQFKHFVLSEQ